MTTELLEQAYTLYQLFDKRSWDAAINQDELLYEKYIQLSHKALNRYERRFEKYRQNN